MPESHLPARIPFSGFILHGDRVALVEFYTEQAGMHYDLPGGGLDPREICCATGCAANVEKKSVGGCI